MNNIKIAPSILSANFSIIGEEIKRLEKAKADVVHIDVMDGVFVNNITFGPKFVKDIRPYTNLTFDAHLMITNPKKHIEAFYKAGADIITIHHEACQDHLIDDLKYIKSLGIKCGAVINPDTPFSAIQNAVEYCDMVLLMSVFPGFGGQKFIPEVLPKIEETTKFIQKIGKNIDLEVDGGITLENVKSVKDAGANVIVAGSTVFNAPDTKKIIEDLKNI